jgi:hypothetical protein
MPMIGAIVKAIIASPAPVLFLDTCVLLDIVRAPRRGKPIEVRVAEALRTAVTKAPKTIHLLVGSPTPTEWRNHILETEEECAEALDICDFVSAACGHTGLPTFAPLPTGVPGLPVRLRRLSEDLMMSAVTIGHSASALKRAVDRVITGTIPAKPGGKGAKDAVIVEHAVEVTTKLRTAHFTQPCIFVSSNTGDFAVSKTSTNLHAQLVPVFNRIQLEYAISLENAETILVAIGWSP